MYGSLLNYYVWKFIPKRFEWNFDKKKIQTVSDRFCQSSGLDEELEIPWTVHAMRYTSDIF
jgi:hypothetical protein